MQKAKCSFYTILTVAIFLILVAIVGTMDYEDKLLELDMYCQNVHTGVWPDYEGSYEKQCYEGHRKTDR